MDMGCNREPVLVLWPTVSNSGFTSFPLNRLGMLQVSDWPPPFQVHALVLVLAVLTEWLFERTRGKKVSEAVIITALLYGLSLPPLVPFWVAAIGIVFAVAVGKEVFGGFGRNVFNPAITGRLFVYISFPTLMQRSWAVPRVPAFVSNLVGMDAFT